MSSSTESAPAGTSANSTHSQSISQTPLPLPLPPLSLPPQRHHSDPLAQIHSPYSSSSPAFNQGMMSASPLGLSSSVGAPSPSPSQSHSASHSPFVPQAQHHPPSPYPGNDAMLPNSGNGKNSTTRRPSSNPSNPISSPLPGNPGNQLQRYLPQGQQQHFHSGTSFPAAMLSPLKDAPMDSRQIKSVPGSPSMYGYAPSPVMNRLNSYEDSYSNHSSPISNGPQQMMPNGAGVHMQQQQQQPMTSAPNGHHSQQPQGPPSQLQRILNTPQFPPNSSAAPPPYQGSKMSYQGPNSAPQNSPRKADSLMLPPPMLPPHKAQNSPQTQQSPAASASSPAPPTTTTMPLLQTALQRAQPNQRQTEETQNETQQQRGQNPSLISKILSSDRSQIPQPQIVENHPAPGQFNQQMPEQQQMHGGMNYRPPPPQGQGQVNAEPQPSRVIEMLNKPPHPHAPIGPPPMQHPPDFHPQLMPPPQPLIHGQIPGPMRPPPMPGDLPESASSLLMPAPGIQSIESEDMDFNQFGPENCQPGSSTQFLSSTAAAEAEKQMLMKQGFTPQGLSHILSNTKKRNMPVKTEYRECKKKFKFLVYENECYQEEIRNLQRKLLKLSRDKNFLLDRLQNFEKLSDSSDDDSDGSKVEDEKPKIKRRVRNIAPATAQSQSTRKRALPANPAAGILDGAGSSSGGKCSNEHSPSLSPSPATTPLPSASSAFPPQFPPNASPNMRQFGAQGRQQQQQNMRSPMRMPPPNLPSPHSMRYANPQQQNQQQQSFVHPGSTRGVQQRSSQEQASSPCVDGQNMSPSNSINQTIQRVVNAAMSSSSASHSSTSASISMSHPHPPMQHSPAGFHPAYPPNMGPPHMMQHQGGYPPMHQNMPPQMSSSQPPHNMMPSQPMSSPHHSHPHQQQAAGPSHAHPYGHPQQQMMGPSPVTAPSSAGNLPMSIVSSVTTTRPRVRQRKRASTARQEDASGFPPLDTDPEKIIKEIKNAHALKEASRASLLAQGQNKPTPSGRKSNSFSSPSPSAPSSTAGISQAIPSPSAPSAQQIPVSIVNSSNANSVKKSNEEDRQNGNGQRMPMIQEEKAQNEPFIQSTDQQKPTDVEMTEENSKKRQENPESSPSQRPNGLLENEEGQIEQEKEVQRDNPQQQQQQQQQQQ
ncbi:hypothetical protein WR25_20106 [Diploscapter pachys]|uniref:INO80 complex subunit E N-terminal domain-containing protein n=1 Tax=Diploscapter pachys TaxID=2018661 RepID=A0A2A2KVS1_9BILA|nr:hypothetical protein WR25_20106 [Diploscapter pachys]